MNTTERHIAYTVLAVTLGWLAWDVVDYTLTLMEYSTMTAFLQYNVYNLSDELWSIAVHIPFIVHIRKSTYNPKVLVT